MASIIEANEIMFTPFEPKVKNRFVMYIEGVPAFLIKAINRPSFESDDITLDHINVKRKLKGKVNWGDLQITLYDPIVPSGAQAVMEWIRLSHEAVTGREGYSDFYKKDVVINMLGPVGDKVEEWILKGAYIKSVNFQNADWATGGEPMTIDVTLRMDYCILSY